MNEKVALRRFAEFVSDHTAASGLPVYIDEPGIWLCCDCPWLAGSPDGCLYETLGLEDDATRGVRRYRCQRSLIEIKTPYKLRKRERGGDFYPMTRQLNHRCTPIPAAYYDQIAGNMFMMGMGQCYFVVLSPTGFQVVLEPLDAIYCSQILFPALERFCLGANAPAGFPPLSPFAERSPRPRFDVVLPAFDERDALGKENVYPGWGRSLSGRVCRPRERPGPLPPSGGAAPPTRRRPPPPDNPQLLAEGWRHAPTRADAAALLAAAYQCGVHDLDPEPVRLCVPPGEGFFCFGNPWEVVALHRWFGVRHATGGDDTTVPPLALQRLWCTDDDDGAEGEEPTYLYHSFLPRVAARLLRSSHHRASDLAWDARPHVTLGLTAAPDVRLRMELQAPRLPGGSSALLVSLGAVWWRRHPARAWRWWTLLPRTWDREVRPVPSAADPPPVAGGHAPPPRAPAAAWGAVHAQLLARCTEGMDAAARHTFTHFRGLVGVDLAYAAVAEDAALFEAHFEAAPCQVDRVTHVLFREVAPALPDDDDDDDDGHPRGDGGGDRRPVVATGRQLLAHALEAECAALHGRRTAAWTFHRNLDGLLLPYGRPARDSDSADPTAVRMPPLVADRWGLQTVSLGTAGTTHRLLVLQPGTGCVERCVPLIDGWQEVARWAPTSWAPLFLAAADERPRPLGLCLAGGTPADQLHLVLTGVLLTLNPFMALEEAVCLATAALVLMCGDNRTTGSAGLFACDEWRRARLAGLTGRRGAVVTPRDLFVPPVAPSRLRGRPRAGPSPPEALVARWIQLQALRPEAEEAAPQRRRRRTAHRFREPPPEPRPIVTAVSEAVYREGRARLARELRAAAHGRRRAATPVPFQRERALLAGMGRAARLRSLLERAASPSAEL